MRIPLARPDITQVEIKAVNKVLQGPHLARSKTQGIRGEDRGVRWGSICRRG